ncbi:MAG: hypothetical protein Q7T79_03205 [bacterium]|nr:hypothetical protein [bacterium]
MNQLKINKANIFIDYFRRRHEKYYKEKKIHLIVDIVFVILIVALMGLVIWATVFYYQPEKNTSLEIKNVSKKIINDKTTKVARIPKLNITISPNQEIISDKEYIAFRLNYKNEEKEKVNNVRLTLTNGNNNFGLASIILTGGRKCKIGKNVLIIESIESNESGFINLKIKFSEKNAIIEQKIHLVVAVAYDINGEKINYVSKSSKLCVLSDLNLKSAGYYYSQQGDQLGIGPLPPTVDMQTNYWIFWEIDNFGNDFKDAIFVAQLPTDIIWIDNKNLSAGNLQYSESTRKIIWTVEEISKNGGNYRAGFEIGVVPSQKDVGKVLKLLSDISFSAYDNFCKEEIIKTEFKDISTNLDEDRLANGKGKVEP